MAMSAFKSTSRRGDLSATSSSTAATSAKSSSSSKNSSVEHLKKQKVPPRRSRSVSVFTRKKLDETSEFLNKRDNPLYWDVSPRSDEDLNIKIVKFDDVSSVFKVSTSYSQPESRTGRLITRNTDRSENLCSGGGRKGIGRSLSRVDNSRRRRSVSRGHYGNCESCSQTFIWDDGASTSSYTEDEEKTIVSIREDIKVIESNGSPESGSANVIDIPPDFMIFCGLESDAGEYARELDESKERASKLRAELAVEEHRELELSQMVKDMIVDPDAPTLPKPCVGRKASTERRKMSRRLEEDAMAYFDECVSISTFDGSEFSSVEDPQLTSIADRECRIAVFPEGSMSDNIPVGNQDAATATPGSTNRTARSKESCISAADQDKTWDPITDNSMGIEGRQGLFSFRQKSSGDSEIRQDIRNYVKLFSKEGCTTTHSNDSPRFRSPSRNMNSYSARFSAEKLLLDRMEFSNRIESGNLLLCSGNWESSWASFPPYM